MVGFLVSELAEVVGFLEGEGCLLVALAVQWLMLVWSRVIFSTVEGKMVKFILNFYFHSLTFLLALQLASRAVMPEHDREKHFWRLGVCSRPLAPQSGSVFAPRHEQFWRLGALLSCRSSALL